jgi:predicted amidohydrolase YtcJ
MGNGDSSTATGPADLVLTGGKVVTLDPRDRVAEAIAVVGSRIARVGTAAEVAPLIGPETRVVQLAGGVVLPGINDSHLHGGWLGSMWPRLLMDGMAAGAPDFTPPPRLETAADRRAAILRTGELLAGLGITSYTEPGLGPGEDAGPTGCFSAAMLHEYGALAAEGRLTARVTALLLFGELDGPSRLEDLRAGLADFTPPPDVPGWFRLAGVKIFADGIAPMRTAWTRTPYPDGGFGDLLVAGADIAQREANLVEMITLAAAAGHQVAVHATGSRAIDVVSRAFAAAGTERRAPARHYVIHGDLLEPDTLALMARAGIGLNTQPGIPAAMGGMLASAVGPELAAIAWPTRDALELGVPLCLSSDAPVLSPDWRLGVLAAVTRTGLDDAKPGSEQRLAVLDALRAYTVTPAWQDGAEQDKGTLEAGKLADLCVLGGDPLTVEPAAIPQLPVLMTVVDGRVVHEA